MNTPACRLLFALVLSGTVATPALARQDPAPVKVEVARFLTQQTQSLQGEVRIEVGEFSGDNVLTPCIRVEAFLPAGTRPWGRITVGVRCLAPSPWSAYVPAQVRVSGNFLVTTAPLGAGVPIGPGDVRSEAGELTAQAADVLTDPTQAIGHSTRVSIAAGRPLAASHLKLLMAVAQGQPVKVVTQGPGFQVANDGTALSSAAEGQPAQVRLANGQVVRGTARAGGVVEITLP